MILILLSVFKSYINEKNITIDGIGEFGDISNFRRFKLDKERKTLEKSDPLSMVEHICSRFHLIAQQLRNRHNNRYTLNITDEYDVQDLLHALLKIHFDDVRPEEYTPLCRWFFSHGFSLERGKDGSRSQENSWWTGFKRVGESTFDRY